MSKTRSLVVAVSLLLAMFAVPVVVASPADASPVTGAALKNGHAVNGAVTSDAGTEYTFHSVAGQHVTVALTNVNVTPESDGLTLSAYDSHGDPFVPGINLFTGQPNEIDFTPTAAQAGLATVVIGVFNAGATGTFTVTYAKDVTGALTSNEAVHPRIRFGGQHSDFTFTAVAGHHVTAAILDPSLSPIGNAMTLDLYDPNGNAVAPGVQFFTGQTAEIDYTPSAAQAGITHVVVTRFQYETTGKFTLGYAADQTRRLTLGKPVRANLKFPGEHLLYTFKMVTGQPAEILVTDANLVPVNTSELQMGVYDPDGTQLGGGTYFITSGSPTRFYTPAADQTGIATAGISSYTHGSRGSFTITYDNSFT